MKPKILFISTYSELSKHVKQLSNELDIPIDIYEGGIMHNGHIYAYNNQHKYDAIISTGGTAIAIKKLINIPCITIETTIVELLEALVEANKYGNKIILAVHETDQLNELEKFKEVFNIDFTACIYHNNIELEQHIQDALKIGKVTVVGMGTCVCNHFKGQEDIIKYVLVKSKLNKIRDALIRANNICEANLVEKRRLIKLKAIIENSIEGIISINSNNIINIFNPIAGKMFNYKANEVINCSIFDFNKSFGQVYGTGTFAIGEFITINEVQYIINRIPLIVSERYEGLVITIQEVSSIQKLEHKARKFLYSKGLMAKYEFNNIIGNSIIINNAIIKAKKFALTDTSILIEGGTGTGKELFAQSIHNHSSRKNKPFVAINCAALPENLLESELFGYEDGAFTGAKKGGKSGLFEIAHGGTIFLDEISEMPINLQSRLLRVLQEKEVLKVGGENIINVDVRVISATNLKLFQLVKEGKFREDLYFRLNILNLKLPSLSQRKDDIESLVNYFIKRINAKYNSKVSGISYKGIKLLKTHSWPGNIRELENFIERATVLSEKEIMDEVFIANLLAEHSSYIDDEKPKNSYNHFNDTIQIKVSTLKEMEQQIILTLDNIFNEDKQLLAERLGISRTTLWKRLKGDI